MINFKDVIDVAAPVVTLVILLSGVLYHYKKRLRATARKRKKS